nr:tyrosine-type recombinase/integrase [Elizabethkingia bruuniana]
MRRQFKVHFQNNEYRKANADLPKNRSKKVLTYYVNMQLKEIMKELQIKKNISYYCARHSFATVLKFNNISIETIREALGQKDIKSTMSYLNSLPDNKLDKIIDEVLK